MKIRRAENARRMKSEMSLFQKKVAESLPWQLPPPPPPMMAQTIVRLRRAAAVTVTSVTRDEIDRYWRVKKMEEEEHLLAALKAAARIRASALSEEDYKRFEESVRDAIMSASEGKDGESNKELRAGIKDWWTKSKYAYLNQPATKSKSMGVDRRGTSAYKPCSHSPPPSHSVPTSLGVF